MEKEESLKSPPVEKFPDMNMRRCPNFSGCSRNFCPLDSELHLRTGTKDDRCRYMREPKPVKIQGREFVSGGTAMPNALMNFVPRSNSERLNSRSKKRWGELH